MKKRKRLNNKGFTLIELLAVIVILAIVMGISANSVFNSINNSKRSSLHSTSQAAANSLNTWYTEDSVVTDSTLRTLSDDFIQYTQDTHLNEWVCLNDPNLKINYKGGNLLTALSLNEKDIVLGEYTGSAGSGTLTTAWKVPSCVTTGGSTTCSYTISENKTGTGETNTCSALRYNSNIGSYEVFLIAKRNGKYYVSSDGNHYAFNRGNGYNDPIND